MQGKRENPSSSRRKEENSILWQGWKARSSSTDKRNKAWEICLRCFPICRVGLPFIVFSRCCQRIYFKIICTKIILVLLACYIVWLTWKELTLTELSDWDEPVWPWWLKSFSCITYYVADVTTSPLRMLLHRYQRLWGHFYRGAI